MTSASAASELCFLQSLGYLAACPEGNSAVGAAGFSTPDQDPCPETPAPSTRLTLSASGTDPYVTVAPLPGSQTSLYLWHVTDILPPPDAGLAVLFCDLVGDVPVVGFESPFEFDLVHYPELQRWALMIDFACADGRGYADVIGEFKIQMPTAVEPESWGRIKGIYR
jgi:hypothetical protein